MPEILSYTRRVRSAMVCGMSSMDVLKKGRVSLEVLVSMFSRFSTLYETAARIDRDSGSSISVRVPWPGLLSIYIR